MYATGNANPSKLGGELQNKMQKKKAFEELSTNDSYSKLPQHWDQNLDRQNVVKPLENNLVLYCREDIVVPYNYSAYVDTLIIIFKQLKSMWHSHID